MRRPRKDFLIAAWASVRFDCGGAWHLPNKPFAVAVGLARLDSKTAGAANRANLITVATIPAPHDQPPYVSQPAPVLRPNSPFLTILLSPFAGR